MEEIELPKDREQLISMLEEHELRLGNIRFAIGTLTNNLHELENSLLKTKLAQQRIKQLLKEIEG